MAIAELEIYSGNVNMAHQGKAMSSGDRRRDVPRPLALLNDGHASYGRVLELPIWLDQWEQRRVLEKQIGSLAGEETRLGLMAQQRAWYSLCFALGTIAVGIVLLMAQARRRRAHELEGLRQQLARDLHDEIGSNLAGIARLSEVAASSSSGEAAQDWQEVRRIASESTDAMREVLWLVGARQEAGMELMKSLKQVANRMLVGKEVIWREWCEVPSDDLPMESRRHFFLFFKEALANIVRHSNAMRVELASKIRDRQLELSLSDNGCGFDMTTVIAGTGLASLRERAKSLNGTFVLTSAPDKGTTIALHIPLN
jgi:signal transduction histidine kinase